MILGVGLEMVDIGAVEAWLRGEGGGAEPFADVFSPHELSYAEGKRRSGEHLAGRWAAKLAFLKCAQLSREEVGPLSGVEVIRHPSGKPELRLAPSVMALVARLGPTRMHLTLSHSGQLAVAMVVIESAPAAGDPP